MLVATNGRQALDRVAEEKPDIVLTDFMMPIMDGAALIRALSADSGTKGIPVLLMSSMPEATVAERCSGYAAFLRKPFRIYDVLGVVTGLLRP